MAAPLRSCCCSPGANLLRRSADLFAGQTSQITTRHVSPGIPNTVNVFDRKVKRIQKNRASAAADVHIYDYLKDYAARGLAERLSDVTRDFPCSLDLGCGRGHVAKYLPKGIVKTWIQCDYSDHMLLQSATPKDVEEVYRLVADEEFIPFKENTFDLVVSCMSLHWVNDLPSTLNQIKKVLKEDGVMIGCMLGGESLYQLRSALQVAETEVKGGFTSHVSPFAGSSDVASLLSAAGFSITTVDTDEVTVRYPSLQAAMRDLRGMGESHATVDRSSLPLSRRVLSRSEQIYKEYYGESDEKHGTALPLTFDFVQFIGWKPSATQPKPARRGSGTKAVLEQTPTS
ncbi:arginine-hydroxylase NDUFAF5, mitochondrial-like [Sycon ciliatum]|uniref:arginine-hydroxylase NDUFAF5, mitochondrial-like n=1 Tax=Sycon ciliatum TaxID=27933 RepID=UPI0020AC7F66|eukprot:scpid8638/ scgid14896/ Probable methyltransferase C20orf7 homolog, mitochondrial